MSAERHIPVEPAHLAVTESRVRELIREELDARDTARTEQSGSSFRFSRFFGKPEQLEPHLGKARGVES